MVAGRVVQYTGTEVLGHDTCFVAQRSTPYLTFADSISIDVNTEPPEAPAKTTGGDPRSFK